MSKALNDVKLIEVTIVLAIQSFGITDQAICGMDFIEINDDWATTVGTEERELTVVDMKQVIFGVEDETDEFICDTCAQKQASDE